jgi:hypothetical protein
LIRLAHEHVYFFPDDLFARVAKYPLGGRIEENDSALPVDRQHGILGRINKTLQPTLAASELRDIPDESSVVDLVAFTCRHLRHRKLDGKDLAALAAGFDSANAADGAGLSTCLIARDVLVVLRSIRFGHQNVDFLSLDLSLFVAEDPLGGRVEENDPALPVNRDDRILGRIDEASQPRVTALNFFFRLSALDGIGKNIGHGFQKVNVVRGERTPLDSVRAEHAKVSITAWNDDAHTTHNSVIVKQRRSLESRFGL